MGAHISTIQSFNTSLSIDSYISELPDVQYKKSLCSSRFMKTVRCQCSEGFVVVKIFLKPSLSYALKSYIEQVEFIRQKISDIPNAVPFRRVFETEKAGYLIREFFFISLYDRISTRPFLQMIEKKWIVFQLLCGLRDCHSRGVYHGDIKIENVMLTSWNWAYLVDFSCFKPKFLPEDNPADFSYFYDSSSRHVCYIAPERFLCSDGEYSGELTDKMDIFSLGCVIAELFLEGIPLFTFAQLLKYRQGKYDPISTLLNRIEDPEVRSLVSHMINLDPEKRSTAEEYLEKWKNKVFPDYFFTFLYEYVNSIMKHSQKECLGFEEKGFYMDNYIDRIYEDLDKIAYSLGFKDYENIVKKISSKFLYGDSITRFEVYEQSIPVAKPVSYDDGVLVFLSLIVSSIRNVAKPKSRIVACDILLIFSYRITDETKHDICLPYLIFLLNDDVPSVRMAALYTITQLLASITIITPVNIHIFSEYILPMLNNLITDPNPCVRTLYASCISSIVNTAQRFLNMAEAFRSDGILESIDNETGLKGSGSCVKITYDSSLNDLQNAFKEHVISLLTDADSNVRRALMGSIASLCMFFCKQKADDIILSHLITYLNDKDWMLRYSFFEHIVGIIAFVGRRGLEEYIMPLMMQALTDTEEFVVAKVISSLTSISELGLFQKYMVWNLLATILRFTLHPNAWIRMESIKFIVTNIKWLGRADVHYTLYSLIRPFLRCDIIDITEITLLENLHSPISRSVFDTAILWAMRNEKSLFWKSVKFNELFISTQCVSEKNFHFPFFPKNCILFSEDEIKKTCFEEKMCRSEDDEQWIMRLRNLGMTSSDEWKLNLFKDYIWKVAQLSSSYSKHESTFKDKNGFVSVKTLNISPKTIFFDSQFSKSKIISQLNTLLLSEKKLKDSSELSCKQFERSELSSFPGNSVSIILSNNKLMPHMILDKGSNSDSISVNLNYDKEISFNIDDGQLRNDFSKTVSNIQKTSNDLVDIKHFVHSELSTSTKNDSFSLGNKQDSLSLYQSNVSFLNKTIPETSTSTENATGIINSSLEGNVMLNIIRNTLDSEIDPFSFSKGIRVYDDGKDVPNFLDINSCNFSEEIKEIDTIISSQKINKHSGKMSLDKPWRPLGTLIARFFEHSKGINRVIVSPDNVFFATASDDGTVKIWDTSRLEKNVSNKSRLTYRHSTVAKVVSICFISNTYCIASGASDGSLHIIKVECINGIDAFPKYKCVKILRKYEIGKDEYAVWMEHFETDNESILMVATSLSRVIALDVRTMKELYSLLNPPCHGTPTCFCIDQQKAWLLLAGTHGILDLWDLRFRIKLKSWGLPGASKIHRVSLHPTRGCGKWVCVAGGCGQNEITVWDIEKTQCREIYRIIRGSDSGKDYEAWKIDDENSEGILGRYVSNIDEIDFNDEIHGYSKDICAMSVNICDIPNSIVSDTKNHGFIVFSGADQKIRFWSLDQNKTEKGFIISGLEPEEEMPTYTTSHLTSTLVLNAEQPSLSLSDKNTSFKSSSKVSRSTFIFQQQEYVFKNHLDLIQDITFIQNPYEMIVSVDRSGVINVYA
ncbi:hypothetical protein PORY_001531 [Pneumocystis oryctolagi]|uniref:Uncharacterized protein n=1 Tax=Pneumocystis oryctolagi TaxID=42067 RepID=A0ACB7CCK7_9ASCO|nr:hypothetical protein PORY_001531 [Pneumocystis oryctolagi]